MTNKKHHIAHKGKIESFRMSPEIRKDIKGINRAEVQAMADWVFLLTNFIQNGHDLNSQALNQVLDDLKKPGGLWEFLYGRPNT